MDIGTAFLVSAVGGEDGNVKYKKMRNAFLEIPQEDFAVKMLRESKISFIEGKRGAKTVLYVLGDDSLQMASIFKEADFRRPLAEGVLSKGELQAVDVLSTLFKRILGEPADKGESCYFSIPADALDTGQDTRYHEAQMGHILEILGYTPKAMNEAHAVVLSTCRDSSFSGLAFSFGAGMVNVCLCFRSIPVLQFAVARGGDWIDRKASESVGKEIPQITVLKEKKWDLRDPKKREHEALAVYYKELIKYVLDNLEMVLEEEGTALLEAIPVVVSGGSSMVQGFVEVFEEALKERDLPIDISGVEQPENPLNSVAAGLLMAARYSE